ncbi:MAG TPA: hypothetical protein VK596_08630 [Edaphobacter sp.]|nr:hypothetical protein [Edaphobacter sp.]
MKLRFVLLFALLAFVPVPGRAQGCAQCRDSTAATSPATQRAYRHGIALLTVAAGAFFLGSVAILRRLS